MYSKTVLILLWLAIVATAKDSERFALAPLVGAGDRGESKTFTYIGSYRWGDLLADYCSVVKCRLSLPDDFSNTRIDMSINHDSISGFRQALELQAKANGYNLSFGKKTLIASPDTISNVAYLSCVDTLVHMAPKNQVSLYKKSDSLRCLGRVHLDTMPKSIFRKKRTSKKFNVRFASVSQDALKRLGVDWSEILLAGALKPATLASWALRAVVSGDSSAELREIDIQIQDTLAYVQWGTEVNEIKQTVTLQSGNVVQDFEYRNYGIQLSLIDRDSLLICDYAIRSPDKNHSVISGKISGLDSIVTSGYTESKSTSKKGIPFLAKIPLIGSLFSYSENIKKRSFYALEINEIK